VIGAAAPGGRLALSPEWLAPLATIAVLLAGWELVVRGGLIPASSIPTMSATAAELLSQLGDGAFWSAVGETLEGWGLGLGIAIALGIPLGVLIGSSRWVFRALRVPIEFLRPIPSVALIPLAVLIYGTGLQSKVFLAAFASFWPLLIQTIYGVQDVDPVATDTARSFGLGRWARLYRVTLPSAVPYIATGVRISSSVALILAVTAELVIGSPGLGRSINVARSGGNLELMYALIVTTGLLGWALNVVATRAERRVLHWHPSQREFAR
jgi:ABC-type nitrate/sulfonate/bicarbonate transport system permease component